MHHYVIIRELHIVYIYIYIYVYIRQSRSIIGTTREITIKYVLNFLSNLFNKSVSWNSIVFKKCALATKMTVELY